MSSISTQLHPIRAPSSGGLSGKKAVSDYQMGTARPVLSEASNSALSPNEVPSQGGRWWAAD